jgi:aspartate ammonia-lyase
MKKIAAMVTIMVFMLGMASLGFASSTETCDKCHKDGNELKKLAASKKIVTDEDLFRVLRKGSKAGLHASLTDDNIREASRALNLIRPR